jgi:hypothetical protein
MCRFLCGHKFSTNLGTYQKSFALLHGNSMSYIVSNCQSIVQRDFRDADVSSTFGFISVGDFSHFNVAPSEYAVS